MQNDHITISEFGEAADDVMTEMAAAGFHGMSDAQADIVVRMGKLLDKAAKIIGGISLPALPKESAQVINRAPNHALAMGMHGATIRGVRPVSYTNLTLPPHCDMSIAAASVPFE